MVTSGGMQGLDLASKLFVDPGDLVVVEAPTYTLRWPPGVAPAGLRHEYRHRKAGMQAALERHFPGARWTDPDGGFFLWLTLADDVDTSELFDLALAEGVAFIPGRALSASGAFGNALRLCFASTGPERTMEGVARLARAVERLRAV